jgi:hypothetical protein
VAKKLTPRQDKVFKMAVGAVAGAFAVWLAEQMPFTRGGKS